MRQLLAITSRPNARMPASVPAPERTGFMKLVELTADRGVDTSDALLIRIVTNTAP
jgi:hypothetical protein